MLVVPVYIAGLCQTLGFGDATVEVIPNARHEVYRMWTAGHAFALKVFEATSASAGERAARTLAGQGVPLPEIVAEGTLPDGRSYMLMTWCEGAPMAATLDRRPAGFSERSFQDGASRLGRVHSLATPEDWPATCPSVLLRFGAADFEQLLQPVLSKFSARFGLPLAAEVQVALAAVPAADRAWTRIVVSHGDYQPKNLIIGATGLVTAIIDWELCMVAPQWSDLAHLLRASPDAATDILIGHSYGSMPQNWLLLCRAYDLARVCVGLSRADLAGDDVDDWTALVKALVTATSEGDPGPARTAAARLRKREAP